MAQQNPPSLPPGRGPIPAQAFYSQPGSSGGRWIWIVVIAVAALVVITTVGVGIMVYRRNALPPREVVSVEERHEQSKEAFADGASVVNDQDARGISAALDKLNAAMQQNNTAAMSAIFDSKRLMDEIDRMGAFASVPMGQKSQTKSGMETGLMSGLGPKFAALHWTSHKVKKIIMSADGREATVYDLEIKGTGPHHEAQKICWWMRKTGSQWKPWDMEALESGVRISTIMSSLMSAAFANPNAVGQVVSFSAPLQSAAAAIAQGNYPAAEVAMKQFDGISVLPEIASLRQVLWGTIHLREKNYAQALKDCDGIEAVGQDAPIVHEIRTISYHGLGQYEEALASAAKWESALGGDRELYYEMGDSLSHLKRMDEAAVAFGKSLDEDPDSPGSLARLAEVLPAGKKNEIAVHFAQCESPTEVFIKTLPTLQEKRDFEAMQALVDAYRARPESAKDPELTYYDAELKIINKQYKPAEAELLTLLPLSSTNGNEKFLSEYLYASRLAGDALEAYGNVQDKRGAFSLLAGKLLNLDDVTLAKLIETHRAGFADDPWVAYYDASLKINGKQYKEAEAELKTVLPLASQKGNENFLTVYLQAARLAGDSIVAYGQVADKPQAFKLLAARLLYADKATLAKLVALHRQGFANDPWATYYDAMLKISDKQYKEAEGELVPLLPQASTKGNESFAREYLDAACRAGDSIDAYNRVTDKPGGFLRLASELLRTDKPTLAMLVSEHLKGFAEDPWAYYYQAKVSEAAKEYDAADEQYAKAATFAKSESQNTIRYARVVARYEAGKGLSAYHDLAPQDKVFGQLANKYVVDKNADGLVKLIAARRADAPDDASLPLWDAQAEFISGDYPAALQELTANRATIEKDAVNKYKWNDLYIRGLVRTKQFDAARAQANAGVGQAKDWWHIAVVECAAGNVAPATEALDTLMKDEEEYGGAEDFYDDADMGPALALPGFKDWREKHPKPATRPAVED